MEHTYLRYECADSFGLVTAAASSKAPPSNSILAFLGSARNAPLMTTAGSYCVGINLKTCQPVLKVGHREQLSGGLGTGRALNSDEVVCLDVTAVADEAHTSKIATGWVDGAVRIFDIYDDERDRRRGMAHSLLQDNTDDEFAQREPLVLNGHGQSPVRSIVFDRGNVSRLASGGSDGSVVLWDTVAEIGLFRLIGHRGAITDLDFVSLVGLDGLITTSLDGLVKVWDLQGQCCTQTIATHRGEVWGSALMQLSLEADEPLRWRLITGGSDGQARVWSVQSPRRGTGDSASMTHDESKLAMTGNHDDVCSFMGALVPPQNVSTSAERICCIHFHPLGKYVGVLHSSSKNIDVYLIRNLQDSSKKRQRRLRRRHEKEKRKTNDGTSKSGQKRGILDDPNSSSDEQGDGALLESSIMDPELMKASDEFEYVTTVHASQKVRGFAFLRNKEKGELARVVCVLSSNALETHMLERKKGSENVSLVLSSKVATLDMHGHPSGIRAVVLSSDDNLVCTISKSVAKIWNVTSRNVIQSVSPTILSSRKGKKLSCYGLCAAFLPGNTHIIVGTREGHLLIIDISAGDVVDSEENAHDGAIWSLDIRRPNASDTSIALATGSADKTVKFWEIESAADDEGGIPIIVLSRTIKMTDDVVAVRYSNLIERSKRMVFVSTLDCTVKVFFDDSLKLFLNLYGHKLPALAVDASDDDILLATSGADKTIKLWGLDFGDTHRTLHGHEDSITDVRFVTRTHNFFSTSKDGTVRYWDGDRFQQILVLKGHCAEVNCLALSRTGAFVLTGAMDRQVRVWERTNDIVFLDEERERALETAFEKVSSRDEGGTAGILDRRSDIDDDEGQHDEPQSEAAVKQSIMSVSGGDRIMDGLEQADTELESFRKGQESWGKRSPNPMLLGLEPAQYVLWILRSIKNSELEQSLLVLSLSHIERLFFYLTNLLRDGQGVELCSRVGIFLIKTHQNQLLASRSLATPICEVRRLTRLRLSEARDMVGYNLAALRMIARVSSNGKKSFLPDDSQSPEDIWAGLGLGSDVAAALEGRSRKRKD